MIRETRSLTIGSNRIFRLKVSFSTWSVPAVLENLVFFSNNPRLTVSMGKKGTRKEFRDSDKNHETDPIRLLFQLLSLSRSLPSNLFLHGEIESVFPVAPWWVEKSEKTIQITSNRSQKSIALLFSLNSLSDPSSKRARRCLTPLIGQALLVSTYTSSNGLISFTFGPTELANTPLESWESALPNATIRGKFTSVLLSLSEPSFHCL